MKKVFVSILSILLCVSCGCAKKEKPAIVIGNIKIGLEEFNEAFKASRFSKEKTDQRKEFLDSYISRKLILKEAESLGLDKDPKFLMSIQLFWEQALLKLALERKGSDVFAQVKVSEQEINDLYEKYKEEKFANKELSKVYDQIKLAILMAKQQKAIHDWVESLKKKNKIEIDYKALGLNP